MLFFNVFRTIWSLAMKMKFHKLHILYGLPEKETREYMEEIIYVGPSEHHLKVALESAPSYGWHSLRTAVFDPRNP
jgi:hypothetical protein